MCLEFKKAYEHRGRTKKFLESAFSRKLFNNGYFFTFSYFFVKFLYLAVAITQLLLLNYWLSDSFYTGKPIGLFNTLFGAHNWQLADRFPRMTLCKFQVYILTDQQTHWVQCTLPVNIYIEKMYVLIYIWLWLLAGLTVFSFIRDIFFVRSSSNFLANELENQVENLNGESLEAFQKYLKADGVMLIRLIKANTNRYYSAAIVRNMFKLSINKQS